jgi:ABC-type Mn2+/Zn2+ transport system ATPase subunit
MLAYMLLGNPELVLLDEPTANVDQPGEQSFYDWVGEIRAERHCTVVLVSHDLSMVYKHATHVFAINRTLCCSGSPEHVMNSDTLKAAFGVDTTAYSHHHGHHHH